MDCLKNLSELKCDSNIDSEFFSQISQICHKLQSLRITIRNVIPDGLINLISTQQNLKDLSIINYDNCLPKIIPSITKFPNNLIKLHIYEGIYYTPLLFIAKF